MHQHGQETFRQRCWLVLKTLKISIAIDCAHRESEILTVISSILATDPAQDGCIVEAGTFKGGSAAKYSLAAGIVSRSLFVFDSFEGIPDHLEEHVTTIDGAPTGFSEGDYAGSLNEVRDAITRYGDISVCNFVKGWFDDTMPAFHSPVAVAYIDVDLASSTRTCLRCLYPLLVTGGVIYSQDGHLPLVVDVLRDANLWSQEAKVLPPLIHGLGVRKLVAIYRKYPQAIDFIPTPSAAENH
jgi:O-methyltransferase